MRFSTDELYFKSPDEMKKAFAGVPEAIQNTISIAERCNVEFELGKFSFRVIRLPMVKDLPSISKSSLWRD